MLAKIAAFEWRYQLRSPVFWVGCLIFFLLTFGSIVTDFIQIGAAGNVHKNSPFALMQTMGVMNVFIVFIVVAQVAGVVLRDEETGFAPILRSTSITRTGYLVGRFTGAVGAAFLVMACVPLAVLVGSWMPWLDPEKLGPLRAGDYAYALLAFGLPTLLIQASAFFAVATFTRSMMWTYIVAVGYLVAYIVMRALLRDPAHDALASLVDPYGLAAFSVATKYWTASERNTQLPALAGLLLANRLLWTMVGLALFAFAARMFRFETPAARPSRKERAAAAAAAARKVAATAAATAAGSDPDLAAANALLPQRPGAPRPERAVLPDIPEATAATRRAQWWTLARHDMVFVFGSPAFAVLLMIGLLNAGVGLWYTGDFYGASSYPVTRTMADTLGGAFTLFPSIIAAFYAGELVWRDRDRRMHEIVDATAAPDWVHVLPKVLAISLVLVSTALVAVLAGVAVQAMKGWFRFEIGHYLAWFVWPTVAVLLQIAAFSVFVQVLVPHKYIGWAVMLLYVVASTALTAAGFEHNLYQFGQSPQVPLSDFNGMGRFWIGQAWFHLYWSACALAMVVLSMALWRRGATFELRPRLRVLGRRLRGPAGRVLAGTLLVFAGSGGWIFYNTNVLNRYVTSKDHDRELADYEKTFIPYENVPRPHITDVVLDVQLYPRDTRAVTTGTYTIVNTTDKPIDAVHLAWDERAQMKDVRLDGATVERDWPQFHYRIYHLARPMQPGEKRTLGFTTLLEERGFVNQQPFTRIVENGTFLNSTELTPSLGFTRAGVLKDRAKRRKYGLPPDVRPAKLEDEGARQFNEFSRDADWVNADITVGTDADQTPIAPGYLQSDEKRTVDGRARRIAHFRTDAPIAYFFSMQSARYAVERSSIKLRGKDVDLAVYYHPGHDFNVDRMMASMKTSLALFDEKFSPYQFHQARILEFPAYARFAQSFANTIPYSEDIGFLGNFSDKEKVDVATYVTAHEIGHQWWGHQLLPADKQGASMLVETFAQYSALLVMEKVYGKDQIRRFLKYELDRYLRSRGGEVVEELPLARVEEQGYIHYQKGALAMYWLKEVVGEEAVDRALQRLLKQYAFKGAPFPDTRDFLALLREEAGPQHDALITDLFQKITVLDLKATNAVATKRTDGKYTLAFDIDAHKYYADGKGVQTESPMDELVDLGVFTAEPGRKAFRAADVMLLEKRRITTGRQRVEMVVDKLPTFCGIDPYNKRIDRNSDDNLTAVKAP